MRSGRTVRFGREPKKMPFTQQKRGNMSEHSLKTTRWSNTVTAENVWKEYPRPAMVRASYYNLNGTWEYAVTAAAGKGDGQVAAAGNPGGKTFPEPDTCLARGSILVPFSPESPLSGVERQLQPDEALWYRRIVSVPRPAAGHRLLLHFGAVDQSCQVYIDGKPAGNHSGGYLPFTLDITEFLPENTENGFELAVRVLDPSDTSWHSRGKQKLKRGGMFYTAQSGIWQTVWMEEVPEHYISAVQITPDFDGGRCLVKVTVEGDAQNSDGFGGSSQSAGETGGGIRNPLQVRAVVRPETESDRQMRDYPALSSSPEQPSVIYAILLPGQETAIPIPDFHPWTPEDPFLYHLTLETGQDRVECYFAMRKCDIQTDEKGLRRLFLNNKPYFQAGVLDQGYWPDGLYTAPCDDALIYDIQSMKDLGYNMLRKHIKIEPQRWYYHCDRLGMLVWQDMVCGGSSYQHWFVTYLATVMNTMRLSIGDGKLSRGLLSRRHPEGQQEFYDETKATIEALRNHPSIVVWVPFNEGWGQFDALKVADFVRSLDSSRIIDHASGWYDQKGGDLASLHYYFFKLTVKPEKVRALVLSEYGGYTWHIPEHSYSQKQYGYGSYDSRESLSAGYRKLHEELILPAVEKGVSATVYTQISDVEEEINGILTYDREVVKLDGDTLRELNRRMKGFVSCR